MVGNPTLTADRAGAVLVFFFVAGVGLMAAPAAQAAPPTAVISAPAPANLGATVRLAGGQSLDDGSVARPSCDCA